MTTGPHTIVYHPNLSNFCQGDQEVGDYTKIHSHVWIGNGVKIGSHCLIEAFAFIPEGVTLEDDVFIGPHVCFTNDKRPPGNRADWKTTLVCEGASIGANATILPGITIGICARIGAGAVVTKDVPAGETWVGNPAHPIAVAV